VNFLYFPVTGIVTLMYDLADGTTSEVALAGTEGMVGISIFMGGERMPGRVQVQSEGYAYRLSRSIMKREFAMNGKLQHLALLYTRALICQTSQTAMCNKHHTVEQQFYRWFLMSIDRLHENKMEITQALISILLGVSRESVVRAAQKLEAEGLIAGAYGNIKVLARHKLEAQACECYETVKSEYDRLLPHPRHAL
jgi:CRP-like cAMP-binding protein